MQGYAYSIFSLAAIVIHLIINFNLLIGRKLNTPRVARYRGFLWGTLAYYVVDGAWGILAGLDWTSLLYIDTVLFFLSMAAFVFLWCRFVIVYLDLGRWPAKILVWSGYALLAFNIVMLAANSFTGCFFHFDEFGNYLLGSERHLAFDFLIVYIVLMAFFVFGKAVVSRDSARRRGMMVFLFCATIAVAILLQVIWPLTPFTALGCLVCNCFFHVFVIQDEQAAKHLAELENALERARAAEKARSMFFSIVSHDIRTPLNAILGYSELLQAGIKDQNERDEALQSIRESGTTLLQLVNDVLDLAKMDSGKMIFHPEPVLMEKLTNDVFASFRMIAAGKKIELVNRTAGVPESLLDAHRFRQILFNLIGNAVKFTGQGSVTVAASYAEKTLEVSVADTGCGIPSDMLAHIMDPFVQVQDPSHAADRAGGTGLGLSICRSLVEAMGGKLLVESELGAGSTFRIRIPDIDVNEEKKEADGQPKPVKVQKLPEHVLIVDDSPVNRAVLTAFLKKAGVGMIDQAGDGGEALAKLDLAVKAGQPHDFVLSDLWMPNMNGMEFIAQLRADPRFKDIPVFALTADTEFRRDVRTYLFTGTLLKPLTYGKLMEVFAAMD
ncbi:MAG: response regulator [Lentisphaeria bacterium]|nr:response regulator [Lentisphaeria bacterium]